MCFFMSTQDNQNPDLGFNPENTNSQMPPIPPQQTVGQPFVPPTPPQQPPQYMEQMPRPQSTMSPYQPQYQQPPYQMQPKDPKKPLAITAMILGIVSLVLSCVIWLAVPCGIVAIVLGAISVKSTGKGMAITGIILGSLGILASVLLIVAILTGAGIFEEFSQGFYDGFYGY